MFKKILIANRGEIACRVIRSAREMGIKTVAVYSEADRDAKHVAMADQAIHIGPAPVSESYLVADKIIQACKDTDAEAVHPGYGFLSENSTFAKKLKQTGIVFIGPGPKAIEAMGDKITSKLIAEKAGVNIIPGHTNVVPTAKKAATISKKVGYPVMIKASAGGGGKGMRVAYDESECLEGFERATSEAETSFGDGRIFIEKFIEQPRHIEIQVLADTHGNVVALNERECSIQRRHQKVIEEAPSPFLDEKTRKAMSDQAIILAKAVDYCSAGTVEFIVDGKLNFYFLEMNTRLQVEHPVTELITGLDLVELMIRIADGEKLPIQQKDISINGWAVESRVYAESPYRNFLPSIGRLQKYQAPAENNQIRVDTGVEEGSEISMFYDPMIAKLVTWGETRKQAITKMQISVNQYYIRGIDTNLPFIADIMTHPRFIAGDLTTNFIAEEYPEGFVSRELDEESLGHLVCAISSLHFRLTQRAASISNQVRGYGRNVAQDWVVVMGQENYETTVEVVESGWNVEYQDHVHRISDDWLPTEVIYSGGIGGQPMCFQIEKNGFGYDVTYMGNTQTVYVVTPETAALNKLMPIKTHADQSRYLLSPMPGLLVSLAVSEGVEVKAGQELAVIEAMKMENSLRAENDGVIAKTLVESGTILEVDQPILEFEPS